MLNGPLAGKMLAFAVPLIASGVLQQSFNAVDVAVVGRYSTSAAIAAVGSNGPVISILVNLFLGIAIGANVVISTYIGRRDAEGVRRSVATVMCVTLLSGILLLALGLFLARPILEAMAAPPDVIELASRYLRIYFCGMPFIMVYNFGSAIMRSLGDTNRPFYSLLLATLCNLVLDWLFTGVMGMGVDGVAWATVISNALNAGVMILFLVKEPEPYTLVLSRFKLYKPDFVEMLRIGVPAGLQGMVFSISNIFIQSAINKFGADAIAGSATALSYEAYCYYIISAFAQSAIAFTGQNYGAGQFGRCKRVWMVSLIYGAVFSAVANLVISFNSDTFLSIFTHDPAVVQYAKMRLTTVLMYQWIATSYEVSGSYMRGLGYSVTPMLLTVLGTCVLRLAWVWLFPRIDNSFTMLLNIYPISWVVTGGAVVTAALIVQRRAFRLKTHLDTHIIRILTEKRDG